MSNDEHLLGEICEFLQSSLVNSLLVTHPNRLCLSSFELPPEWSSWWSWASEISSGTDSIEPKWLTVLHYYMDPPEDGEQSCSTSLPPELRWLVGEARRLQLPRSSTPSLPLGTGQFRGMSPKKAHEVDRMVQYISHILSATPKLDVIRHAVDIGAGQAYLSRKLRDDLGLHVLALDWSDVQTQGAARKDASAQKRSKIAENAMEQGSCAEDRAQAALAGTGSLTYKTMAITSDSLLETVTDWIREDAPGPVSGDPVQDARQASSGAASGPTHVLLVALHACGSLTPSILRAFLAQYKLAGDGPRTWTPQAAVIVGCCYNMLDSADFPLCRTLSARRGLTLTSNHLQLAAQVPSQWLRTEESAKVATVAVRKVVWRALLEGIMEHDASSGRTRPSEGGVCSGQDSAPGWTGPSAGQKRLGRLNDSAYADWRTFLARSASKLEINITGKESKDRVMESRLEVFHVLRCLLGPVIESLMLLDRQSWLQEELQTTGLRSELVNLFDQSTGSGRNVAIVIMPKEKAD
ncbi:hypothetical protein OBBRIDRAFT_550108 [Obba rivulosa]|uniref:Methyltransferase domain-containing protein n=1 Tax=Obba rivulosa TaxID=1052685 RepID=A0A8E2B2Q6_9APHY|nr:hypothetical protein OBBRIDRAFT_550108 [Obba rivulosa]